MAKRRKLVVVVRIDAPWPEGSADLNDAIDRVLVPTLHRAASYTVIAGYEPARRANLSMEAAPVCEVCGQACWCTDGAHDVGATKHLTKKC